MPHRIHAPAIRYFDAVRRAGSIREAARRLNVASSAVNRQILKLEDDIGAQLFERRPSGLRLTTAGEAVARHVLHVLQDADRLKGDIEGFRGDRTGHVTVATIEGVCAALLPEAIGDLRAAAPGITVTVTTMGSRDIPAAVESGEADIGVAFAVPLAAGLRKIGTARFRLGAIMKPDHALAAQAQVGLSACMEHAIVMASADLSIQHVLAPLLVELDSPLAPVLTTNSIELMRALAERGTGIAFHTRLGIEQRVAAGRLVHVPLDAGGPIWSVLEVYVRAGRVVPAALDMFVQRLLLGLRQRESAEHPVKPDAVSAS